MSKKEEYKFRFYRGEAENPYDPKKEDTFKANGFWFFEKTCADAGIAAIEKFYDTYKDDIPDEVFDFDVSMPEKKLAAYILFCGDGFVPASALTYYFSFPPFNCEEWLND